MLDIADREMQTLQVRKDLLLFCELKDNWYIELELANEDKEFGSFGYNINCNMFDWQEICRLCKLNNIELKKYCDC